MLESKVPILYVDDEPVNLLAFKANFRRDFNVYTAESAQKGIEILSDNNIKIVIADQRMPEMTGIEFFEKINLLHPETVRILLTGFTDISAVIDAINKGKVYGYVTKPWNQDELKKTIESALLAYAKTAQHKNLKKKYRHLFEMSSDAILIVNQSAKVVDANTAATNLLGYSKDEFVALNYGEIIENDSIPSSIVSEIEANGLLYNYPVKIKTKNQNLEDYLVSTPNITLSSPESEDFQVIVKKA